jgi:DNA-binding NtrC family response regulator
MPKAVPAPRNILALGLDEDLFHELENALCAVTEAPTARRLPADPQKLREAAAAALDLIFCPAQADLVRLLRQIQPDACIVAVSPQPDVNAWLDAMDAGASDYCAAPFDPNEIAWVLETNLGVPRRAVSAPPAQPRATAAA